MDDDAPSTPWSLAPPTVDAGLLHAVAVALVLWIVVAGAASGVRRLLPASRHAPSPTGRPRSGRYGLIYADDDDDDDDAFDNAVDDGKATPSPGRATGLRSPSPPSTARAVGELHRSPAFAAYLRSRGLTYRDVAAAKRRLDVYRELRDRDTPSFAALVDRPPAAYETGAAPRTALALDWALGGGGAGAVAGLLSVWRELAVPPAVRGVATACAVLAAAAAARGRSPVRDLWWEDAATGGRAAGWRAVAAVAVDAAYGTATLGTGSIITLLARLATRKSLGDRLAGVQLVRERRKAVTVA